MKLLFDNREINLDESMKRNRIEYDDEPKIRLNYFKKFFFFFQSPIIKFLYDRVTF
jgi:hypothetical protein